MDIGPQRWSSSLDPAGMSPLFVVQSRSRSCFVWYCAYPRKALSCKSCRSTVSQSVEFTGWRACTLGRYTSVLGRIYFFKSMQGARLVVTSVRT
mmetsp:Transcript_14473/g.38145  ORF Transcript_14473/g.38145 Transcript_14473/m.38145 type:complete len:94 (+) Transcript_14473:207-488(+)